MAFPGMVKRARVIRIKNTLTLGEIECSEVFLPEIEKREGLTAVGEPRQFRFDAAGTLLPLGH